MDLRPDVDGMAKQLRYFASKTKQIQTPVSWREVDQEIDVALGCCVPPDNRAEDPDVRHATPGCDAQDLIPPGADPGEGWNLYGPR